jgi:predicted kinase
MDPSGPSVAVPRTNEPRAGHSGDAVVELVVFVGLQGSGKTTFYRSRFAATHAHVSKDNFRHHRRPAIRQRRLIEEALAGGRSVVVDNTNVTAADRAELVALGRAFGAQVTCYYFPPDVAASLARNAGRAGKARVPDHAIQMTARRLQPPTPAEGFDRFHVVRIAEEGGFIVRGVTGEGTDGTGG